MNHKFLNFIFSHGDLVQMILFVSLFFISWTIENVYGVFFNYRKWKHAFINAPFIITNLPGQLLLGVAFVGVVKWTSIHHFGLLYSFHIEKNHVLLFLATFILLDFGEYIYHVFMHKTKTFWRFHLVHHSDKIVDISTTLREHPAENLIRLSFTLLWVFFTGAIFWTILLRQIIQVFTTMFAHINYRLPEKMDSIIGCIFITPNLHQVHHHYQMPYTNCNYGDVFSFWDRLFGTFKKLSGEDLKFGVDTHMRDEETANFKKILKMPFV